MQTAGIHMQELRLVVGWVISGRWRSLVAHLHDAQVVGGSSPSRPTEKVLVEAVEITGPSDLSGEAPRPMVPQNWAKALQA
jgi:hypothetical protein